MTQPWIAVLLFAGIILIADLLTTYLRRRARRVSPSAEATPKERELEGVQDGEVACDRH